MADLLDAVVENYLRTYRGLLAAETVDENSVVLSFPFHYASNHRIEITITKATKKDWLISDLGRIITELRLSGYRINKELHERLIQLAVGAGVRVVNDYLVLDSTDDKLGDNIQKFLEAAKTIGDVYFVHKEHPHRERELVRQIKELLDHRRLPYKEHYKIGGEIEAHKFDFYVPPNGTKGLALAVLSAQNTHTAAQVWGFRCDDVRRQPQNKRLRLGLIYDTQVASWSDESRRILESRADIVLTDKQVIDLPSRIAMPTQH